MRPPLLEDVDAEDVAVGAEEGGDGAGTKTRRVTTSMTGVDSTVTAAPASSADAASAVLRLTRSPSAAWLTASCVEAVTSAVTSTDAATTLMTTCDALTPAAMAMEAAIVSLCCSVISLTEPAARNVTTVL